MPHDVVEPAPARRRRLLIRIASVLILLTSGTAFTYKIAEFIFTLTSDEVQGFAEVPVTVYFVVAGGWLCLLTWCFLTGKFKDMEEAKWDPIRSEEP